MALIKSFAYKGAKLVMACRSKRFVAVFLLVLSACAPDNLDITPTAAPTPVPIIKAYITGAVVQTGTMVEIPQDSRVSDAIDAAGGATDDADLQQINLARVVRDGDQIHVPAKGESVVAEATAEAAPPVTVSEDQALLDHLLSSLPGTINAGVISWRRDNRTEPQVIERDNGVTGRVSFNEAGGGLMELTFGVFDSPDAAAAYYTDVRGNLRTLERAQERDIFPTPNAFGGGTYGSDAIFARDNLFIRISIPRFSSTAGDPLVPMARQVFTIVDNALASFTATG